MALIIIDLKHTNQNTTTNKSAIIKMTTLTSRIPTADKLATPLKKSQKCFVLILTLY